MPKNVLALDIGGTNCRLMMMDESRREIARRTIPTNPNHLPSMLRDVKDEVRTLGWSNQTGDWLIDAVGIAVAGNVENGVLLGSGNLPGWKDWDLVSAFGAAVGVTSVAVLNDCAAAALGEYSAFQQPLVYVIWGTGVGAAVVTRDGETAKVKPTELGHMIVDYKSTEQCGCGGRGHLEALIGGGNLEGRFGVPASELSDEQWEDILQVLAAGLRTISCGELGLPIVLGGGVIHKQQARLSQLQQMLINSEAPAAVPMLALARHGEDSGLLGAAESAFQLLS